MRKILKYKQQLYNTIKSIKMTSNSKHRKHRETKSKFSKRIGRKCRLTQNYTKK